MAQGVRRLEAVTGHGALAYVRRLEDELGQAAESFRSGPFEIAARVAKQAAELRERDKEIAKLKAQIASGGARDPLGQPRADRRISSCSCTTRAWPIRRSCAKAPTSCGRAWIPACWCWPAPPRARSASSARSPPARRQRCRPAPSSRMLAKDLGGKGGGRADMAQGGGALPAGASLADVIERWTAKLREHLAAARLTRTDVRSRHQSRARRRRREAMRERIPDPATLPDFGFEPDFLEKTAPVLEFLWSRYFRVRIERHGERAGRRTRRCSSPTTPAACRTTASCSCTPCISRSGCAGVIHKR